MGHRLDGGDDCGCFMHSLPASRNGSGSSTSDVHFVHLPHPNGHHFLLL
ncbi:hypothetical protein Leryth_021243 [Lithospermum erythrorhizon]|nr:hypothetical protein Leryth_021243 [Lithospermum erythrorhizon]